MKKTPKSPSRRKKPRDKASVWRVVHVNADAGVVDSEPETWAQEVEEMAYSNSKLYKEKFSSRETAATLPKCSGIYYLCGAVPRPCCEYGGCKREGCPVLFGAFPDLAMENSAEPCALVRWFREAADQALVGKGFERHNLSTPNLPFEEQTICRINREFGTPDFALGQAWKKLVEARGMWARNELEAATKELQGAAVYLAAASLSMMQEEKK